MPLADLSDDEVLRAMGEHGYNASSAARELGCARSTLQRRMARIEEREAKTAPELPSFPEGDIPVKQIIGQMAERFERRWERHDAEQWFEIKLKDDKPYGIAFVGDPHLDSNGCNWTLLNRDIDIMASAPGLYAVNIGDTVDGWAGRLAHLYADSDSSEATAIRLARWFMQESGISWLVWLLGNHDTWKLAPVFREMNVSGVPMMDWGARFKVVSKSGHAFKVWASHDFAGHSMWNSLHGPQKFAHMRNEVDLYVCGHKHNWALHEEESATRGFIYWLARARGYKYLDDYAMKLGHFPQEYGASITAVVNPSETGVRRVRCFPDLEEAADWLDWLRSRAR